MIKLKINDFLQKYYLHDSLVENIVFDGTSLIFYIELCYWKQKEYRPSEGEMKKIKLIFENVNHFNLKGEKKEFDSDTILIIKLINNECDDSLQTIELVLEDEEDIKVIQFKSDNVKVHLNWE